MHEPNPTPVPLKQLVIGTVFETSHDGKPTGRRYTLVNKLAGNSMRFVRHEDGKIVLWGGDLPVHGVCDQLDIPAKYTTP